jgi:hypothetical protein
MKMSKKDILHILLFIAFIAIGLLGSYSYTFFEGKRSLDLTVKWLGIPSLIVGCYFGYYSSAGNFGKIKLWRAILSTVALCFVFTILSFRCFQGYLMVFNSTGQQKIKLIVGKIEILRAPKTRKPLNGSTATIRTNDNKIIVLEIPNDSYEEGDKFERIMKVGRLGILYSSR